NMSVSFLVLLLGLLFHNGKAKVESQGCHSPDVERTAEEVLQQINQDRTDGYILTLNRLYDLSSTSNQEKSGSVYNLTIDVLETKCHSISKKPWKQCEVRGLGDIPVYGECQASVQVDAQVKLESYSCALREVAATAIVHVCPDCPTADNLNEPVIKETAKLALQKFNKESHLANYFALGNITKASLQWVVGPSYFVEFTVLETECSKETDFSELTHCQPMNCQFAHRGFCTGSHKTHEEKAESVEVKCEIYEPQHVHSVTQGSDVTVSNPKGLLGRIVFEPATPRSAPTASSCPSARRHNLGLRSPLL
uniref:Si:ch211-284e20.8 n=1 Tax=Poecilia formosa TaxID=48698 RepID=A0A096M076_POEFO